MKVTVKGIVTHLKRGDRLLLTDKQTANVIGFYDNKIIVRTEQIGESKPIIADEIEKILTEIVEKAAVNLLTQFLTWLKTKLGFKA
jgi:hypothetical protein